VGAPEAPHVLDLGAQSVADKTPWTPQDRPPAQLCAKAAEALSHRLPIPRAGRRKDELVAAGRPEARQLLPATGRILPVQVAQPARPLLIETALRDRSRQVATEFDIRRRNPEPMMPAAAREHLASSIERQAVKLAA